MGGGPGTAQAVIYSTYFTDRGEVSYEVNFSLVPFGAGYLPDDAAPARLDGLSIVPGTIFPILREALTGNQDEPKRILISHADLVALSEAVHA